MARSSWRSSLKQSRGRSTRKTTTSRRPLGSIRRSLFESLEDRVLLTVTTPVLGTGNDVVFNGDMAADSIEFSVETTGLLQHNRGGVGGFTSNIDLDSATTGDQTRMVSDITSLHSR